MWFNKRKKSSKTEIIAQIPGIEPECAEALKELGFESASQLKSKDAEEMYYELSIKRGKFIEKIRALRLPLCNILRHRAHRRP